MILSVFVSFKIDGKMLKDFLNDIEKEELAESPYAPWSMLKPYCFNMIKGKRTVFILIYECEGR